MYYYGGYNGAYTNNSCGCSGGNTYPTYGGGGYGGGYGYGTGNGYAIILVLFILLVIIIGSRITV